MRQLLFAFALAACASAPLESAADPSEVIAAERAFAAEAGQRGWAAAFRAWHAPGAIVLQPDPVEAAVTLAQIQGDGGTNLDWRPAYGGVSRDGGFGFTTGPFQVTGRPGVVGHYFTVWRRQGDGQWRWIFDAGTDVADPGPMIARDARLPTVPIAARGAGSAESAIDQVRALEAEHAGAAGLATLLAPETRVNRVGAPSGVGQDAGAALFAADGAAAFRALRYEASSAGDMVFALGEVRDQHEGAERLRYYARIWQFRSEGWRIVFDEIVPRRDG
jgi:ketosteroid isomerase-like protein